MATSERHHSAAVGRHIAKLRKMHITKNSSIKVRDFPIKIGLIIPTVGSGWLNFDSPLVVGTALEGYAPVAAPQVLDDNLGTL